MILPVSRKTIFPRSSCSRDRNASDSTSATITTAPCTPPGGVDGAHPSDARFELGEIEEVAPVDGKILNLIRRQNALHRRLFTVDRHRLCLNAPLPWFQP